MRGVQLWRPWHCGGSTQHGRGRDRDRGRDSAWSPPIRGNVVYRTRSGSWVLGGFPFLATTSTSTSKSTSKRESKRKCKSRPAPIQYPKGAWVVSTLTLQKTVKPTPFGPPRGEIDTPCYTPPDVKMQYISTRLTDILALRLEGAIFLPRESFTHHSHITNLSRSVTSRLTGARNAGHHGLVSWYT